MRDGAHAGAIDTLAMPIVERDPLSGPLSLWVSESVDV